jgi:hypothetical protein
MTVAKQIFSELGASLKAVDVINTANGVPALPFTVGSTASGDALSDWVYVGRLRLLDRHRRRGRNGVAFDKDFAALPPVGTTPKVGQFIGVIRAANTIARATASGCRSAGQANVLVAASAAANTFLSTTTTAGSWLRPRVPAPP